MKEKRPRSFFIIGATILAAAAVTIGLLMPNLTSAQQKLADSLIAKAQRTQEAGDSKLYLLYLHEAELVSPADPRPRSLHGQYYLAAGDYKKAIDIYQDGGVNPNYAYLGNLALKAQDYSRAARYFDKASREGLKTQGLAGKAISYFNLKKISQGCSLADEAFKLDINNRQASRAKAVCVVLSGGEVEDRSLFPELASEQLATKRGRAYFLAGSQVLVAAEAELESSPENTPSDWLFLAKLASSRGEYKKAAADIEQGLKKSPADWELLHAAVDINEVLASKGSGKERQNYQESAQHFRLLLQQIPR